MATIIEKRNKAGQLVSYKVQVAVGRDERNKQIWRTKTFKRPEGLTPARERKEIQRLADAWAEEQKAEYNKTHSKTDKTKITLSDFINMVWFKDHIASHTPNSVRFYESMTAIILRYFGDRIKLSQIDAETVKRFANYMKTEAKSKTGEPYSDTTQAHVFSALRSIFKYALRFRYIKEDPTADLLQSEKPHRQKKKVEFLTVDQARTFLKCAAQEPKLWETLINVLLLCGLRRGEAVGLKWSDIDSNNMTINIARSVAIDKDSEEKFIIKSTKTGQERTIPLPQRVYALLMELKAEREKKLGLDIFPNNYIFCREDNPALPLYVTSPTDYIRKFEKRYGLPLVSPHDLRHSCASLLLQSGANVKQVQTILGHQDAQTTLDFYVGSDANEEKKALEKVSSLLAI